MIFLHRVFKEIFKLAALITVVLFSLFYHFVFNFTWTESFVIIIISLPLSACFIVLSHAIKEKRCQ